MEHVEAQSPRHEAKKQHLRLNIFGRLEGLVSTVDRVVQRDTDKYRV